MLLVTYDGGIEMIYGSHYSKGVTYSGSTDATPEEVTVIDFGAPSGSIYVRNTEDSETSSKVLWVCFDWGEVAPTWFPLPPGNLGSIGIDLERNNIALKSDSSSTSYVCLVVQ